MAERWPLRLPSAGNQTVDGVNVIVGRAAVTGGYGWHESRVHWITNVRSDREPAFWDCVLREGRREGHDSVALLSGKVPVSNGTHLGSIFAAVEGVDRQERRGARAFTGDYERLGQKTFDASRQTGGWVKAAGVVAAGGTQAQSGSKRCMNSCDALLCILSVRGVSIELARSGANCRVNSCVALLSLKKILRMGAACRVGCGGVMVLQLWLFCQTAYVCKGAEMVRCGLALAAMGTAYTVVQALARGKEQVGR